MITAYVVSMTAGNVDLPRTFGFEYGHSYHERFTLGHIGMSGMARIDGKLGATGGVVVAVPEWFGTVRAASINGVDISHGIECDPNCTVIVPVSGNLPWPTTGEEPPCSTSTPHPA